MNPIFIPVYIGGGDGGQILGWGAIVVGLFVLVCGGGCAWLSYWGLHDSCQDPVLRWLMWLLILTMAALAAVGLAAVWHGIHTL